MEGIAIVVCDSSILRSVVERGFRNMKMDDRSVSGWLNSQGSGSDDCREGYGPA